LLSTKGFACTKQQSYEMNLIDSAQQHKMSIIGLVTASSQLAIFDKMSKEDIQAMFHQTIKEIKSGAQQTADMITQYKKQNIDSLYQLIKESPDISHHEQVLLIDRNKQWVKMLQELMSKESSFVAVGAGYFSGDEGLIRLLQLKGYYVEPIN
jgi:Uncharacterized protein conserved in bacteria